MGRNTQRKVPILAVGDREGENPSMNWLRSLPTPNFYLREAA
jgi:hypothetical protein